MSLNSLKEKLLDFGQDCKRNIRKVLVWVGIIGVATAATITLQPEKIPSAIAEGQVISFPYTDNNSGEDILIYTDQQTYHPLWAWNGFDVYVAVKNKSGKSQDISFNSFFSKSFTIESVDILNPSATTSKMEMTYQEVCNTVATTTPGLATTTQCYQKENGIIEKVLLGVWNSVEQKEFVKADYDRLISDRRIEVKQKTGDKVAGSFDDYSLEDSISYYRLRVKSNEPFSQEEFDLEILGNLGGYGLLDPTIMTETFNSYTDGDLNGQGSWIATAEYDVQGVIVQEGTKAVKLISSAGGGATMVKSGPAVGTGDIRFFVRPDIVPASESILIFLFEGGSNVQVGVRFNGTSNAILAVSGASLGSWVATNWYQVDIEWQTSDNTYRVAINGGAFSGWQAGDAFTNLDKIYILSQASITGYIDNISGAAAAAEEYIPMEVYIIE